MNDEKHPKNIFRAAIFPSKSEGKAAVAGDPHVLRYLKFSLTIEDKFALTTIEDKFALTTIEDKFSPTTIEDKFALTTI